MAIFDTPSARAHDSTFRSVAHIRRTVLPGIRSKAANWLAVTSNLRRRPALLSPSGPAMSLGSQGNAARGRGSKRLHPRSHFRAERVPTREPKRNGADAVTVSSTMIAGIYGIYNAGSARPWIRSSSAASNPAPSGGLAYPPPSLVQSPPEFGTVQIREMSTTSHCSKDESSTLEVRTMRLRCSRQASIGSDS
jgi:hypothetical protein